MESKISYLVLDFKKEAESRTCLESIRKHSLFPHKIVYLDNGSNEDYPWELYKENLCDVLISKKTGFGGGFGQTDLIRFCDTEFFFFVQNDQELVIDLTEKEIDYFINLLNTGYHCIDTNGDQSNHGVWTDRVHFMRTEFFNSLGPFPNGGPGNDAAPWNEEYLQKVFKEKDYKIAHINPAPFKDCGKWSIREAGDGLFKHRCDTKEMWVVKTPTYKTEIYPPLNNKEFDDVMNGKWPVWGKDKTGRIPETWKKHSFRVWI